jgi:hypothetical protein
MRSKRVAHVDRKKLSEAASLLQMLSDLAIIVTEDLTHAFMVTFLSLLKIRMSERSVMFLPTTNGLVVVPEM